MGRIPFDIPDDLEIRLDAVATKLYGHKKGKKKKAVKVDYLRCAIKLKKSYI
ncbi:hypothetical protein [Methanooceanicella nereidis]|uniref:hypothetical protein n=1 Tax=Methanooceanicella nereidis TaxID=2052831 RepID=UPI001E29FBA9|nr:hypothetical protein [Methanocella sp. CWC-04]